MSVLRQVTSHLLRPEIDPVHLRVVSTASVSGEERKEDAHLDWLHRRATAPGAWSESQEVEASTEPMFDFRARGAIRVPPSSLYLALRVPLNDHFGASTTGKTFPKQEEVSCMTSCSRGDPPCNGQAPRPVPPVVLSDPCFQCVSLWHVEGDRDAGVPSSV